MVDSEAKKKSVANRAARKKPLYLKTVETDATSLIRALTLRSEFIFLMLSKCESSNTVDDLEQHA